jgi:hypothetical protein
MAMFGALKAVNLLRLSEAGEVEGMDIDQHGISAYPEFVISALTAPQGMSRDTVGSGNVPAVPGVRSPELAGAK